MASVANAVGSNLSHTEMLLRNARFIGAGKTIGYGSYRQPYHVYMGEDNQRNRGLSPLPHVNVLVKLNAHK